MGGRPRLARFARGHLTIRVSHHLAGVFIVVTVETQQLPVTPVRRIVRMVVVLMIACE